jgi:hypothetical protein
MAQPSLHIGILVKIASKQDEIHRLAAESVVGDRDARYVLVIAHVRFASDPPIQLCELFMHF